MTDNINENEPNVDKQISEFLEKEYKINKGTVTLTIVPKIDGSQENGKVNAAEVRINMTGDVGTNPIDGVNRLLYGLFRSSAAISKYPTFNKQDNSENELEDHIKELEDELKNAFPEYVANIIEYKPYVFTDYDNKNKNKDFQNGKEINVGELVKRIDPVDDHEGGNKGKSKAFTKRKKTQQKRSKKQIRKTKGKKNTNNRTKNKNAKNGKKK
jgi:hypothetical protein